MRVKPVVIIGAGGFGREVLEIFKDGNKTIDRGVTGGQLQGDILW